VLLAAVGRSTRSIAEEVGIQPRIVSNWWRRFAEPGLGWLKGRSAGEQHADLRKATNQRIWRLLDKPAPVGYARWMGRCWPGTWAMSVWRFLREHNIAPAGRKSWRQNCRRWSAAMSIPLAGDRVGHRNRKALERSSFACGL
jgi:transposase